MAHGGAHPPGRGGHGGVGAEGLDDATLQRLESIRRFQELFHGRFTEREAQKLLQAKEWDLGVAVAFVFESEQADIREIIDDGQWTEVLYNRNNRTRIEPNARANLIEDQVRQFGCARCDFMWWRRVPTRKMVSKCRVCRKRYVAIPRDREWGWAKFQCAVCNNAFNGFGAMNKSASPCFRCHTLCEPIEIMPPYRREKRRTRYRHSCTAPNCYNRTPGAGMPGTGPIINICVHPKSLVKKVIHPSAEHHSTGSTVKTFLNQNDLESFCQYEPSLADISDHSDGDDGDNM